MRTFAEYKQILELWELDIPKKRIAIMLGIPRATVRDCINRYGSVQGLEENRERASRSTPHAILNRIRDASDKQTQTAYAYLLGLYLGDGDISKYHTHRVHRLRVALDKRYPEIIEGCVRAIEIILPDNQVDIVDRCSYVHVSCYHKFWPEIIPQDGDGPKHKRKIILEPWQQKIVDCYPLEFFRGLYHSDGTRFSNVVNGKDYPRYGFTNYSKGIRQLFCDTCNKLGIHWTVKHLSSAGNRPTDIFISRRKDVDYLDSVIGPKS